MACWLIDPHARPSFVELLRDLRNISTSTFVHQESFHILQDTWKLEIENVLREVSLKEQEILTREEEVNMKLDLIKQREQTLDKKAQELEMAQRKFIITMLQQGGQMGAIGPRPTPKKRKGHFRRKALKKEQIISEPSDFRHTLTVKPAESQGQGLRSFSSPETPPDSPNVGIRAYVLPPGGVKGKTWGPSSIHQKERGKIISKATDSPKRWSKSAPNLEKSQKFGNASNGSSHTIQQLDYGNCERSIGGAPLFSLPEATFVARSETRKPKLGAVQSALYRATNLLASIGIGRDVRKGSSRTDSKAADAGDAKPTQVILFEGLHNDGFGTGEAAEQDLSTDITGQISGPKYFHNTYHGQTRHNRPALTFGFGDSANTLQLNRPVELFDIPANFDDDEQNTAQSAAQGTEQMHFHQRFQHPLKNVSRVPQQLFVTSYTQRPSPQSPGSSDSEIFYSDQCSSKRINQYVDTHYSTEEMQQLPHPPPSCMSKDDHSPYHQRHHHHPQIHRSDCSSEPFESPETTSYSFNPDHSVLSLLKPSEYSLYQGESDPAVDYSPTSENLSMFRVFPEVVYNMQLASGSGESGYHGFDGITSSSSTNSTNPRTPSRHGGYSHGRTVSNTTNSSLTLGAGHPNLELDLGLPGVHNMGPTHQRSPYDYEHYRTNVSLSATTTPVGFTSSSLVEGNSMTERPVTLELPRQLRSSLRKYNYTYSPTGFSSTNNAGFNSSRAPSAWTDSAEGTVETPPDSSLSEDSSYVSAKDSLASLNSQHSSVNRSVRFSPITMVGSERVSLAPDLSLSYDGGTLLDMPVLTDRTVPLQAYRSSNARNEHSSSLRKVDYDKIEFFHNF